MLKLFQRTGKADNQTNKKERYDYSIAELSAWGITGFIVGCIIIFFSDLVTLRTPDSIFHEIIYQPKEIVSKPISDIIPTLEKTSIELKNELNKANVSLTNAKPEKKDSINIRIAELNSQLEVNKKNLDRFKYYKNKIDNTSSSDTTSFKELNSALHFDIEPQKIDDWDSLYSNRNDSIFPVNYIFKDADISVPLSCPAILKIANAKNDIAFLTKYPSAGVWILLMLVFFSCCFIAVPMCIYLDSKVFILFKSIGIILRKNNQYFKIFICIFSILVFIVIIWNSTFYDDTPVRDILFMKNFSILKWILLSCGYISGACCLAGFIRSASLLANCTDSANPIKQAIVKKELALKNSADKPKKEGIHGSEAAKSRTGASAPIQEKPATESEAVNTQTDASAIINANLESDSKIFGGLFQCFNTYFTLSAIILSVIVLCIGGLFTLVNSLDFVKLIADDWGYSPARTDFIYLYGGLNTIILLLIYIPARRMFIEKQEELKIILPEVEESKWFTIFKSPFNQFKDILVAASPLLVSIIQSLFDTFFS